MPKVKSFAIALILLAIAAPTAIAQTIPSMFVYQISFWLNLHQFLRGEIYRRGAKLPLGVDPATLSDADRAAWSSAIDVYTEVAKGDLVFDENARRIANALAMTNAERLSDGRALSCERCR